MQIPTGGTGMQALLMTQRVGEPALQQRKLSLLLYMRVAATSHGTCKLRRDRAATSP